MVDRILFGISNKVYGYLMNEEGMRNESMAALAQVLAHPTRISILRLLREEGAYVMHLSALLGRPQANISQHLTVLREAGLVVDVREGMSVVYRVRDRMLFEVLDGLESFAAIAGHGSRRPVGRRPQVGRHRRCRCPRCRERAARSERAGSGP